MHRTSKLKAGQEKEGRLKAGQDQEEEVHLKAGWE